MASPQPILNDAAKELVLLRQRIIADLWEHPTYQALIKNLNGRRPVIPYWNPREDNTREMQAASAAQKWHDVMMAIIDPQKKYAANPKGKDAE